MCSDKPSFNDGNLEEKTLKYKFGDSKKLGKSMNYSACMCLNSFLGIEENKTLRNSEFDIS